MLRKIIITSSFLVFLSSPFHDHLPSRLAYANCWLRVIFPFFFILLLFLVIYLMCNKTVVVGIVAAQVKLIVPIATLGH